MIVIHWNAFGGKLDPNQKPFFAEKQTNKKMFSKDKSYFFHFLVNSFFIIEL